MTKLDFYAYLMIAACGLMIWMTGEIGAASVFLVAAVGIDILRESRDE